MRRMKERVSNALHHFQVQLWSHRFYGDRWRYAAHVVHNFKNRWPYMLAEWFPLIDPASIYMPYRGPGRPRVRWDDQLHGFCIDQLGLQHWTDIERFSKQDLAFYEKAFIEYCM